MVLNVVLPLGGLGIVKITYKTLISGESDKWGRTVLGGETLVFKCMSLIARTGGINGSALTGSC